MAVADCADRAPPSVDAGTCWRTRGRSRARTCSRAACRPSRRSDQATYLEIDFEAGDPVALNGEKLSPATLLARLNKVRKYRLIDPSCSDGTTSTLHASCCARRILVFYQLPVNSQELSLPWL